MTDSSALQGKIILITGASSGIGKATSIKLASLGAKVLMVARQPEKARTAQVEIQHKSGSNAVELLLADCSRLDEVRRLAQEITAHYPNLDILINNAAVFKAERTITPEGFETMFATNYLAPFLLTNLLLNTLQTNGNGHVINMTAPSTDPIKFNDLQSEKAYNPLEVFSMTKMSLLLFTFELAHRLQSSRIRVNALYPGLARTDLMREAKLSIRIFVYLSAYPTERAAQAVADLATKNPADLEMPSGGFYYNEKQMAMDSYPLDREIQNRLWEISARLTGL
ncbi:MAG TPA: SDR family NAD(P)-dependent oxidoreductase [Anaerolineaceae bacterium]